MGAPRLNRALVLETPVQLADGAGGFLRDWQVLGTLWAEVVAGVGTERAEADVSLSMTGLRITVRAAPVTSAMRPRPEQRFRDGARLFRILAVAERDSDGRYLLCSARQESAT